MLSSIAESEEKETVAEYGILNESLGSEEPQTPTLPAKEQALMDAVVHMGHWLNETERDASLTVDIIDLDAQRDAANHMQVRAFFWYEGIVMHFFHFSLCYCKFLWILLFWKI